MRAINCAQCRKKIHDEEKTEFLKHEYAIFQDSAYSMAVFATVCALAVQMRRGRSRAYIRTFFDEMCWMFDMPPVFGKQMTMTEAMKILEKDYGIEFKKIKVHLESEKEFLKGVK